MFATMFVAFIVLDVLQYGFRSSLGSALEMVFGVVLMIGMIVVAIPRFRDLGYTGWAVLIFYIPLVNIVIGLMLSFKPGQVGSNKYGPPPLRQTAWSAMRDWREQARA